MDPEHPVPATGEGVLLRSLPAEAIEKLVSIAGASSTSPLLSLELRHLGGELGRPRAANGALACVDADYALIAVGPAPAPEVKARVQAHVEVVTEALGPWTADHSYLNLAEARRDPRSFWAPDAYERLCRIKTAVDPDDLIRSNHPVR
jgi:hypothetical protein